MRAPKPRRFKERIKYLETIDDINFLQRFRMSKRSFQLLLNIIGKKFPLWLIGKKKILMLMLRVLLKVYFRSHAISAETKMYAALRFYATGSFLITGGDFAGISTQSMSNVNCQRSLWNHRSLEGRLHLHAQKPRRAFE